MTPLTKSLKRTLRIRGRDYVLTLSDQELKLTLKGHQKGLILEWDSLVSGESALAVALQASVGRFADGPPSKPAGKKPGRAPAKKRARPK
jgi:hypothetical protein